MSIKAQQATVYYAPTAGRRFFTRSAAINKEARAIIKKHFPDEPGHDCSEEACGWCQDPGWSLEHDQPERFKRYHRMLTGALRRAKS
ncbi:hypothetical protein EXN22_16345 [Pseudomonas tructae]|uniref:Uncharacterized protein n=1 Tax=Pseudomonas tructae TaxID=2518644 RepID=A0A411MK62_9PSED|nr:hypothetical protein [Pseudomonas tructae]QBF27185.1 hypothetical protein EXN22_16345 [Pseudomonas tructae]